jgi:hypothetical protein
MHMGRRIGQLLALLAISSFGSSLLAAPVGVFENAVDIGQPPGPGSTVFDGARYTMRGSGADIWDGGDQFHFAYRRIFGDFQATIRITSRSTLPAGSGSWGRYGLMARWGLETNAKYSLISGVLPTVDAPQAAFGPFYQFRLYNGLNDGNRINYSVDPGTFPANGNKPNWMRLVRHGGTIYGYLAEDANSDGEPDRWCLVGSDSSLSSVPSLLVGVALHSQSGANLGTIVFDNVTFERPPDAIPLTCDEGAVFAQRDFTSGLGSGAKVAAPWSPYTPRVQGGRLNLTPETAFGVGAATWFDFGASTQELAADGFVAEFDAYMSRTGVIFGDVFPDLNPADGLTFAVVERGSEILGACPDRSEPRVARFTSSALPWSGAGCAPAVLTSDIGDLTPSFLSTNSVRSQGDIWSGGDSFLYQYASLTGDFDVAVELRSYAHSTGVGRWGKFGLMVRQTLDPTSRFTMVAAHGPSLEDPARMTGRTVHLDPGDVPMYESIFPAVGARPRFQRLTRRGNRVQGWVSDNPGLADGALNPYNDCNWIAGAVDDWGPAAPATLLVGFANSNHNSSGCAEQLIQYRGLPAARPSPVPLSDLVGFGGGGLGYGGGSLRGRTECHPSFAVELDNWVGGGEPGNEPFDGGSPTYDGNYHVGLDVNAEVSSIQTNVDHGVPTSYLPFIFDPANGVHVKVRYEPGGTVTTYIRSNVPPAAEYEVLSERIPPLAGPLLFGFTVGTGAATATQEVDNLVVRRIACTEQPRSAKKPVLIDLGNVTGGGDGSRHSLAPYAGVDQRNGTFVTAGFDGRINDNDGNYIAAGPAPFIDSVFFIEPRLPGRDPPQAITQSGVAYFFGPTDSTRSSWNFILKDRTGGLSAPGINVGGITDFTTSVGLHSAMGITYDLDALRATHGAENVQCFSTVWGLDNCATGDVNLYALLSQESGVISQRSFHATAGFLGDPAAPDSERRQVPHARDRLERERQLRSCDVRPGHCHGAALPFLLELHFHLGGFPGPRQYERR